MNDDDYNITPHTEPVVPEELTKENPERKIDGMDGMEWMDRSNEMR